MEKYKTKLHFALLVAQLLLLLASLSCKALASVSVNTQINKSSSGDWIVTYTTPEPTKRLAFIRNPDNSRVSRWLPLSNDIEIIYEDEKEFIQHKQGKPFTSCSFKLTPTYKHLSKDYAPFSPYSSGGTLFHSGRLFACAEQCDDSKKQWGFSLTVPKEEHIILNGEILKENATWIDFEDGRNIYVGNQPPIETPNFIALIDNNFPKKITKSLNQDLPKMMHLLQQHLGSLPSATKPTLFASYAKVKGGSSQGGTLPNQIFMHWNMNDLEEKVKNEAFVYKTLWFFAHEAAHLYQRAASPILSEEQNQSWLHEGQADYAAEKILSKLYPVATQYIASKQQQYRNHCVQGLKQISLAEAAKNQQFFLYYTCGYFIHQAIEHYAGKPDTFTLWNEFRNRVLSGSPAGAETFLKVVSEKVDIDFPTRIQQFIDTKHSDPNQALEQLLKVNKL